jgi:uncharacterized membrane protein YgaE (UPF0421/DUF939 family)
MSPGSLVVSIAGVLALVVAVVLWVAGEHGVGGLLAVVGIVLIGASDPPWWGGAGPAS